MKGCPTLFIHEAPIYENVMLVGMQFNIESLLPEFFTADIL